MRRRGALRVRVGLRVGGRRGQAAVLLALSLFAMLLLLAMATNIGTVVNDKIRVQSTADLATYAVAYSEAASLNVLVAKNEKIAGIVKDCRRQLESGPIAGAWPGTPACGCNPEDQAAEMIVRQCMMELDDAILDFANAARYDTTVGRALKAGEATAKANFRGSEKRLTFFEDVAGSPTYDGTYRTTFNTNVLGVSQTWTTIAQYAQVSDVKLNYAVQVECGSTCATTGILPSQPHDVHAWFYKNTDKPDVWVAGRVAGTPRKRFLDTDYSSGGGDGGYFGASSTGGDDLLVAYSVAKPYDGSVGPSRGGTALRSATTMHPTLMGVYWSHAVEYPKMTMVDEYRARMAGVKDGLSGSTTPERLVEQDGGELGRSWDMDRFEH